MPQIPEELVPSLLVLIALELEDERSELWIEERSLLSELLVEERTLWMELCMEDRSLLSDDRADETSLFTELLAEEQADVPRAPVHALLIAERAELRADEITERAEERADERRALLELCSLEMTERAELRAEERMLRAELLGPLRRSYVPSAANAGIVSVEMRSADTAAAAKVERFIKKEEIPGEPNPPPFLRNQTSLTLLQLQSADD